MVLVGCWDNASSFDKGESAPTPLVEEGIGPSFDVVVQFHVLVGQLPELCLVLLEQSVRGVVERLDSERVVVAPDLEHRHTSTDAT